LDLRRYISATIVPWFTGNAFFIFLLRQYMRTIPLDFDEAAHMDGAGYWRVFWCKTS
jgi:ABC-type glycerol-3-phosphate transport system permease component